MKTAREFADVFGWGDDITKTSITALIEARDAEHRAELLKLQDDLLQGANREVMAEALIERLRGELGEAKRLIAEAAEATCPQRFSEPGRPAKFSDCGSCWTCRAQRFLAAPPPVAPPCTASAGSCNSPKACGEGGRCIDARMREVVAPAESTPVRPALSVVAELDRTPYGSGYKAGFADGRDYESTPVLCEQHGREDCPRSDHAAPSGDYEFVKFVEGKMVECDGYGNEPGWREGKQHGESVPIPPGPMFRLTEAQYAQLIANHTVPPDGIRERLDDHERRLAALEAKGEPGTHAKGEER